MPNDNSLKSEFKKILLKKRPLTACQRQIIKDNKGKFDPALRYGCQLGCFLSGGKEDITFLLKVLVDNCRLIIPAKYRNKVQLLIRRNGTIGENDWLMWVYDGKG